MNFVDLDIPATAEGRAERKAFRQEAERLAAVETERAACEEIARSFERQAWGAPKATATLIAEGIAARKAQGSGT